MTTPARFLLLAAAALVITLAVGCAVKLAVAATQAADFYECPPNRALVVCAPGTTPGAECTYVGSGMTTIPPRGCA